MSRREGKGEYYQGNVIFITSKVSSAGLESKRGKGGGAWELQPLKEAEVLGVEWRHRTRCAHQTGRRRRTGVLCISSSVWEAVANRSNHVKLCTSDLPNPVPPSRSG